METENLAIMFTDIKGFTSRTSKQSRAQMETLLDVHEKLVGPIFGKFRGKVVKTIGDAFLVTFKSPTDALLCGMQIQRALTAYNHELDDAEKIEVRVAVNSGEVNVRKSDVFGEPVNIAARIEGIAEAGDIYFTESVYLAMNKNEIPSAEIGYRHLQGIPYEVKVYKVLGERDIPVPKVKVPKVVAKGVNTGSRKWIWWGVAIFILFLLILGGQKNNNSGASVAEAQQNLPSDVVDTLDVYDTTLVNIDDVDAWLESVKLIVEQGDTEKAAIYLSEFETLNNNRLSAAHFVGASYLYEVVGNYDSMVQVLQNVIEKDPSQIEIWEQTKKQAEKGIAYFGSGSQANSAVQIRNTAEEKILIIKNGESKNNRFP